MGTCSKLAATEPVPTANKDVKAIEPSEGYGNRLLYIKQCILKPLLKYMKQNYPPCPLLPPSITIKTESGLVKLSGIVIDRKCHQIGVSLTVSSLFKFNLK